MSQPVDSPAATLLRLVNGYQISHAIHVAAELRLADLIGDEPVSVPDLSTRVGAHPESLYRLLRALSTVGAFRETEDRLFVASPMSKLLRTDNPQSMRGWPMFIGRPYHRQMWGDLLHSVRTGEVIGVRSHNPTLRAGLPGERLLAEVRCHIVRPDPCCSLTPASTSNSSASSVRWCPASSMTSRLQRVR